MSQFVNINSQLDALRMKEFEKKFYTMIPDNIKVIPKVTPFKGVNVDLIYIKDNKLLFIKFMDTSEDLFSILDEEIIEVMNEEFNLMRIKMTQHHKNISYNFVYIMPHVEIYEGYEFEDFVNNNVIDKNKLNELIKDDSIFMDDYFKKENNEIELNMYILDACPEYYVLNNNLHLNKDFKKITFVSADYNYSAALLDTNQLQMAISINYGNSLIKGGCGSSKTTLMLARAMKLARVYPQHRFVIFVSSKKLCNQLKETIQILYKDNSNLEVHTMASFLFKLAKKFDLVADYRLFKSDYDKYLNNLMKQAKNVIKNKNMFKGIFIDEVEAFKYEEIKFIEEFLYKTKHIFNLNYCDALNINNSLNIFKHNNCMDFDEIVNLESNYKQSKAICEFVNRFCKNSNEYIKNLRPSFDENIFPVTKPMLKNGNDPEILKVSDLEEQIEAVLWEIDFLVKKKGLDYSEIAIIYPYNKKKLKNGKTIYFQYILKKALEEAKIPYMMADDDVTRLTKKVGITVSNIYKARNLEYKAVILCELEMLYNQTISDKTQDYQVNDFVGDLNKIYLAINIPTDYLKIITAFDEEASEIIKLLTASK